MSASGDGWKMYTEQNVVVAEFTEADAFDAVDEIRREFVALTEQPDVTATIAHMNFDRSPGDRLLDGAAKAAEQASDNGLERWAAVADGIERVAMQGRLSDTDVEVMATRELDEAMEWARDA
jgi:hypothetical protein